MAVLLSAERRRRRALQRVEWHDSHVQGFSLAETLAVNGGSAVTTMNTSGRGDQARMRLHHGLTQPVRMSVEGLPGLEGYAAVLAVKACARAYRPCSQAR